VFHLYEILML